MDSKSRRRRRSQSNNSSSSSNSSSSLGGSSHHSEEEKQRQILRISNLSRNVKEVHLREIFSNYGSIKQAEIIYHPEIQKPKGVAYIEFDEERELMEALACWDPQNKDLPEEMKREGERIPQIDGKKVFFERVSKKLDQDKSEGAKRKRESSRRRSRSRKGRKKEQKKRSSSSRSSS